MGVLDGAQRGFTVDRVSGAADLAVKFAAIVVAIGAIALVFFGPKIEIKTYRQTFIDRGVLRRSYEQAGEAVPRVARKVSVAYNDANTQDLLLQQNLTGDQVGRKRVCEEAHDLVKRVFPSTNCNAAEPVIGRNHLWERLLILRLAQQTDLTLDQQVALAKTAVERMYDAQYVKVRTIVTNNGHARAINVNVRVPTGFSPVSEDQSVSPFTLGPDEPAVERFYRTASGIRESEVSRSAAGAPEGAPVTRFGVDWERDQNAQASAIVWVGVFFFVLWVAIVFNDSRLHAARAREASTMGAEAATDAPSPPTDAPPA